MKLVIPIMLLNRIVSETTLVLRTRFSDFLTDKLVHGDQILCEVFLNDFFGTQKTVRSSSPRLIFCRPPTKLRIGNVFSRVCMSVCSQGSHVTITHDTLDVTIQGSPDMFKRDQFGPHCTGSAPRHVQTCSL